MSLRAFDPYRMQFCYECRKYTDRPHARTHTEWARRLAIKRVALCVEILALVYLVVLILYKLVTDTRASM